MIFAKSIKLAIKSAICIAIALIICCSYVFPTWHVDVSNFEYPPALYGIFHSVPLSYRKYAVYLPKTYEVATEDFEIRLDFFEDYYRLGDFVQARVTMKNISGKYIKYVRNGRFFGSFKKDQVAENGHQYQATSSCFASFGDPQLPNLVEHAVHTRMCEPYQQITAERVYWLRDSFFAPEVEELEFCFFLDYFYVFSDTETGERKNITFSIPVEIKKIR